MRWQADMPKLGRDVVWVCLVLMAAGYGALIVRNVSQTLVGIVSHQPSIVVAQWPNR